MLNKVVSSYVQCTPNIVVVFAALGHIVVVGFAALCHIVVVGFAAFEHFVVVAAALVIFVVFERIC